LPGLIISIVLAILIIAALGVGFYVFNKSDDAEDQQSRLHLSQYDDSSSNELRVESAKIADIKANIEKFLERMEYSNLKFKSHHNENQVASRD
jgi:uncharacterized protein HemX